MVSGAPPLSRSGGACRCSAATTASSRTARSAPRARCSTRTASPSGARARARGRRGAPAQSARPRPRAAHACHAGRSRPRARTRTGARCGWRRFPAGSGSPSGAPASSAMSCGWSVSRTGASASRAGSCGRTAAGRCRRRRYSCPATASSVRCAPRPGTASSRQAIRWSSDYLRVPLKLVTGPANAAKAGEVLGGLRARLDDEPILVVPTVGDVDHSQRELAERGAVFGARVMRFDWLFGEIAARAGFGGRAASDFQRELIVEAAVRAADLHVLRESATQSGFVRAAARFVGELGPVRPMVEPARFTRALRDWAGDGPRRAYADEVAAVYRGYRTRLEAAGLVDEELFAWGALRALGDVPAEEGGPAAAWGGSPVFVYGFDDFNGLQLEALDLLATRCDADVTISLPYEPGRLAFKAVSGVHQELLAIGAEEVELPPLDDHYADESRTALHHMERRLFDDEAGEPVAPGAAISFHSAGGARAEGELVGARVLALLREGVEPGDVAVVFRDPMRYSSLLEQVFGAYGIPYSIDRRLPFGHTGIGRGLLALIRAAGPAGTAEDLLAYLRTPGLLRVPGFADSLEAEVRRNGARRATDARERWERDRWPLDELDRLASARDTQEFVTELER